MRFDELIYQGVDPGANVGGTFTASLAARPLVTKKGYLDSFFIGLKAATATAPVTMPTFLQLLQPFTFQAGQEIRINLQGQDLFALNMFMYGSIPYFFSADTTADDTKIFGIRVPIWEKIDPSLTYSWSATRVAQTNVSAEVFELAAQWHDNVLNPHPIIASALSVTLPAATGRSNLNVAIPQVGDIIGILVFNATTPSETADTASVQRLQLYVDGNRASQFNQGSRGWIKNFNQDYQDGLAQAVYSQYMFVDLRDDPIDAKNHLIGVEVDVEHASDAIRIIPIMVKK